MSGSALPSPLPRRLSGRMFGRCPSVRASLLALLAPLTLLSGCASRGPASATPDFSYYVVLGENAQAVARVLIDAPACPALQIDQRSVAMRVRSPAASVPLRPTVSPVASSKPSVFPLLTCEAELPPAGSYRSASVLGRALPVQHAAPQRIVVLGDTGCRLADHSKSYQACNDTAAYPFARIAAAAAAWQPDLVIHVGDYHYRENACPPGNAGCAGSPWGYGWDVWQADFFAPGARLLQAAPWIMARGNHENCSRAGQGYWRWLDPRPLLAQRDCDLAANDAIGNYSPPYAVPIGQDTQLLVIDSASTSWRGFKPDSPGWQQYRDTYRQLAALAAQAPRNLAIVHHPILGMGADRKSDGSIELLKGDAGLQQAFGSLNPLYLPDNIQTLLSGHVHLWQQMSFSSAHPNQFVSGFSGTAEDLVPLPERLPDGATPAAGAVVEAFSHWVDGFGYMTMERQGADQWQVQIHDLQGQIRNRCQITGRHSRCEIAQVK